ncbi:glyoxal oxidase [Mycena floridula]|nr:glyoxal oxidase [Mycena floridula]
MLLEALSVISLIIGSTAADTATASAPGQPLQTGTIGGFEIVGESLVSAQQLFLGRPDKVYIVDKVENNPAQINGHPAWASEYTVSSNKARTMNAITNSFCAGGAVMGNGTWLNVGGNQAVTYGGEAAESQTGGGVYDDPDGRRTLLTPCDDGSCDWFTAQDITTKRWYPTVETLADGTLMILGGCVNGGYVNSAGQDNPTYEFFPSLGDPILSPVLQNSLPTNLYPLTWLLPSNKLLIQSNWDTVLLDYKTNVETKLDRMLDAVRTYPASAGTVMMPLTPANNYTATVLFCGGTNLQPDQWKTDWNIAAYPASTSCVTITPDLSPSYTEDDPLPVQRSMANLIFLPDGRILCLNGAQIGIRKHRTAGYGNNTWAIGHSYADGAVLTPVIYDPSAPKGQKWTSEGLSASTVPRMYHSSATLLPDGSVFIAGSNPNPDYTVGPDVKYPTEYRVEKFFPSYYNTRRPQPEGLITQLGYGGDYFNVDLDSDDLFGLVDNVVNATVVLIRTGFSTHSMNMGQRFLQLQSSYTGHSNNNTATLHVNQLPPNPATFAPGPALLFVVVNGVPSVGIQVMVGSGKLGQQTVVDQATLPDSQVRQSGTGSASSKDSSASYTSTLDTAFLWIGTAILALWAW